MQLVVVSAVRKAVLFPEKSMLLFIPIVISNNQDNCDLEHLIGQD
jgi:hypothetical protein